MTDNRWSLLLLSGVTAHALAFVFLVSLLRQVVAANPPLRLFSAEWTLQIISTLLQLAPFALLALILMHAAASMDQKQGPFQALCQLWRRWALVAVIGYGLLIPVTVSSTVRSISRNNQSHQRALIASRQRLQLLDQAIRTAPDAAVLQERFQPLRGPQLSSADRALPMPALRERLSNQLQGAEATLLPRLNAMAAARSQTAILDGLLKGLLSLAYAMAFAAGAQSGREPASLLEKLLLGSQRQP